MLRDGRTKSIDIPPGVGIFPNSVILPPVYGCGNPNRPIRNDCNAASNESSHLCQSPTKQKNSLPTTEDSCTTLIAVVKRTTRIRPHNLNSNTLVSWGQISDPSMAPTATSLLSNVFMSLLITFATCAALFLKFFVSCTWLKNSDGKQEGSTPWNNSCGFMYILT